jgi:hypothetical protein
MTSPVLTGEKIAYIQAKEKEYAPVGKHEFRMSLFTYNFIGNTWEINRFLDFSLPRYYLSY